MASDLNWTEAMFGRLMDGLTSEYDLRTKELIGQAFLGGLAHYPDLLSELKSSSLIESDYFDDDGEEPEDRIIEGHRYRIIIKTSKRK